MNDNILPTYDQLTSLVVIQIDQISQLQQRVFDLEVEIVKLRKGPPNLTAKSVPAFVKENKPAPEDMSHMILNTHVSYDPGHFAL